MVLIPAELKISRSLAKSLRNRRFEARFDSDFESVIRACAAPRDGQPGTWITPEMRTAYLHLHRLGYAHSVETWIDGELAGGLYGVALGAAFFGESMFARARDASKIALVHLVRKLEADGYGMIDCQMRTEHLASLGAREIPRAQFSRQLRELVDYGRAPGSWRSKAEHEHVPA
jgi:leucyl/phenylalanyl-tRNA--protein transferase